MARKPANPDAPAKERKPRTDGDNELKVMKKVVEMVLGLPAESRTRVMAYAMARCREYDMPKVTAIVNTSPQEEAHYGSQP